MDREVKEFIVQRALSADSDYINSTKHLVFAQVERLLESKGEEYSSRVNRFENFIAYARAKNISPEQALRNMQFKHTISIDKFVFEIEGGKRYAPAKWVEKIGDEITYLILLRAMVTKRYEIEQAIEVVEMAEKEKTKMTKKPEKKPIDDKPEKKEPPKLTVAPECIKPRIVENDE